MPAVPVCGHAVRPEAGSNRRLSCLCGEDTEIAGERVTVAVGADLPGAHGDSRRGHSHRNR